MPAIDCRDLIFHYGSKRVLDGVSFDVAPGEMFGLLGPSGCGKTTTLNVVGGFVTPDQGAVRLDGRDVTGAPPERRDTAMVFQSYALFPHLTVRQNIAFGLRYKKLSRQEVRARVTETLQLVNMTEFGDRYPRQLSGGQQQRVAVARAVAVRPKVLLLDEPLSNLDAALRTRMRAELSDIQRTTGIASLFVTHDQEEAMAVCDRLAVMRDGVVEQVGSPSELYEQPESTFVAGFLGRANFLSGTALATVDDMVKVRCGGAVLRGRPVGAVVPGEPVQMMVRPVHVRLDEPPGADVNRIDAVVQRVVYLGDRSDVAVEYGGTVLQAQVPAGAPGRIAAVASLAVAWWPAGNALVFPAGQG